MSSIRRLINASAEELLKLVYKTLKKQKGTQIENLQLQLSINKTELVCGLGFNPCVRDLPEIIDTLGFSSYDELANERNRYFTNDVYQDLTLRDILIIFEKVADDSNILDVMQYLLLSRLDTIEKRIEKTVSSVVIERYKKEVKAIYTEGIARIEFAESRLDKTDSGFRALVNEVENIVNSRLIPVGDIFFRSSILPEERRRMINKNQIPVDLIRQRLNDDNITRQEQKILTDALEKLGES